jgi:hypothetical protein
MDVIKAILHPFNVLILYYTMQNLLCGLTINNVQPIFQLVRKINSLTTFFLNKISAKNTIPHHMTLKTMSLSLFILFSVLNA